MKDGALPGTGRACDPDGQRIRTEDPDRKLKNQRARMQKKCQTEQWNPSTDGPAAGIVLGQIRDLIVQTLPLQVELATDLSSLSSKPKNGSMPPGIQSVAGTVSEEGVIRLRIGLLETSIRAQADLDSLFDQLSRLGDKIRLLPPLKNGRAGVVSYEAELSVQAVPLSLTRSSLLVEEIRKLDQIARSLHELVPVIPDEAALEAQYGDCRDVLAPVIPWHSSLAAGEKEFGAWCDETLDFLRGSLCVAVEVGTDSVRHWILARLARGLARAGGTTLGRLVMPLVGAKNLPDIAMKAPGIVSVDASCIGLGTNPYELGQEIQNVLTRLSEIGKPMVFTGTGQDLQAVFQGGQGGTARPHAPVVRHAPAVAAADLLRFELLRVGRRYGGVSASAEKSLTGRILGDLDGLPETGRLRVLPFAVDRALHAWFKENPAHRGVTGGFAAKVGALNETLSGLSLRPRPRRSPAVEERFVKTLTDPGLLPFLSEHLLAQSGALEALCGRLAAECLTRPGHQPICFCAQGTPATGKSRSTELIAERLGIPRINIDAAGIPDFYTASAQLLGSGRGIVNSFQPGRLEQAARHHSGVLIEVSDLDHAEPRVRASLADLFLQVLETGEAQSASGVMFGCANCIFAFTINLPEGLDETVRRRIGFSEGPGADEIRRDVQAAIKGMFSGAFLSRIGEPILFEPLDGAGLVEILERAARAAVLAAAERLGRRVTGVHLEPGLCLRLLERARADVLAFGARILLEKARAAAAAAVIRMPAVPDGSRVIVSEDSDGRWTVQAGPPEDPGV
jgi:hypothetical protein